MDPGEILGLVDWKRRVLEIYRELRVADEPARAWTRWRDERDRLFKGHSQSPIPASARPDFQGLCYFDYNPAARVLASVIPVSHPQVCTIEASNGAMEAVRFARAGFTLFSRPQQLGLYWFVDYAGGLFLSFRDATSGTETYGGCRYLLDTVKGADLGMLGDRLVLDFNFSYQPSCAYDPRWSCPLAPPDNRLSVAVRAGERRNNR